MTFISEVYCKICDLEHPMALSAPISMICPMSGEICDGGGNRHQTAIKRTTTPEIIHLFGEATEKVIPAVCSITYSMDNLKDSRWIVCPRKLFSSMGDIKENKYLQKHEIDILTNTGLPHGVDLGIWAEVYLKDTGSDNGDAYTVNYHFDYLVCPLTQKTVGQISEEYQIDENLVISEAKRGGFLKGQVNKHSVITKCPDLTKPVILEIMTASTSGSDTEKGTNISAAFLNRGFKFKVQHPVLGYWRLLKKLHRVS